MNIAELSIKNKTITLFLTFLMLGGGILAFDKLGRLEDPEYTIKDALVYTAYPGATAIQVEEEVTDKLEIAIQQLPQLKRVESLSKNGLSTITVKIKDKYDKEGLPQVWDELRRKVNDVQGDLPPGTSRSIVYDDFGDVYGILFAITGEGYSYKELEEFTDFLRRELLLVKDVAKIQINGVQAREVHVDISRNKLAQMGISLDQIYRTLEKQNTVQPAGAIRVGDEYIRLRPTGQFETVEEMGNILLRGSSSGEMVFLKDVATITEGYKTPPDIITRFDNEESIWLGISLISGGNVVNMGEAIKARLKELKPQFPAGMDIKVITFQPDKVTTSINGFLVSLAQALGIVVAVLILFMGLKSGMLIGGILLLTVFGTFVGMQMWGINLERISLGALIIALGMLVDNAIVITEGMMVKIESGVEKLKAARDVVGQTSLPLLGATFIAILAFSAVGLSDDSTGEYTRSLFEVILISLMLSWIIAVTVTPLFCTMLFKPKKKKPGEKQEDPYGGFLFVMYRGFLKFCLRFRWITMAILGACLVAAIQGFAYVENAFFPFSTTPQFMIHYWLPEGTDIRKTAQDTKEIAKYINSLDHVTSVAQHNGAGAPRFMLTYSPEKNYSSYAFLLVNVDDFNKIDDLFPLIEKHVSQNYPNAMVNLRKFALGPGEENTLQFRFSGPNPTILRQLADKTKAILRADNTVGVKDDWRERVKVVRPQYAEAQGRLAGIGKASLDETLQMTFSGKNIGIYRDRDKLLHILSRAPEHERDLVDDINNVQIWSPFAQGTMPLTQVIDGTTIEWEDAVVQRRDRKRTIKAQASQRSGNSSAILERVLPKIQALKLPLGYEFAIGGEYEDSADAQAGLFESIPKTVVLIIIILVIQFNSLRQPLIILLTVPLAIIGVTVGLLGASQPFSFMALLGVLSLVGMLIKNSIVLIDQIDLEIAEGKDHYLAILDSSVSRMRPVAMAAFTTVLGMIPLLPDIFFVSMAVTIMAGLSFATVLTLIVVPVLYAIMFRIKNPGATK